MGKFEDLVTRFCAKFGLSTPRELRYWWLHIFRLSYVQRKKTTRKGACNHCGDCCNFCPWRVELGDGTVWCKDWQHRPFSCRTFDFPLDEKDKRKVAPNCSYYWDSELEKAGKEEAKRIVRKGEEAKRMQEKWRKKKGPYREMPF